MPKTTLAGNFTSIKRKKLNFVFLLQVFFVFAIFVFRETRFFRNFGSFAKLRNSRNSSLIFAKHENRFVASFAKFSRNEISSKTLAVVGCGGRTAAEDRLIGGNGGVPRQAGILPVVTQKI